MEFNDVVRGRRSVRAYASAIPPREVLDRVVDAARRAPSAGFSQGIDFLVIDDPGEIDHFWAAIEDPDHGTQPGMDTSRAPVVVLVLSDPQRYLARYSAGDKIDFGLDDLDRWPVRFWDVDAGMAAMQLQLAAVNAGLATWFFGIAHGVEAVRVHHSVPADRMLCGVIALGYRDPDEVPTGSGTTRKRRALEDQLHYNVW
jgi:nitroreductase